MVVTESTVTGSAEKMPQEEVRNSNCEHRAWAQMQM